MVLAAFLQKTVHYLVSIYGSLQELGYHSLVVERDLEGPQNYLQKNYGLQDQHELHT